MSQLQDVSFDMDERRFLVFRASVLAALSARPELRRLGVLLQGDDGLRLIPVDGVSSMLDLWSWLVANAHDLLRDAPKFAALIIPWAADGALHAPPVAGELSAYDLDAWLVDDRHRVEKTGFRCSSEGGDLLMRLPLRLSGQSAADAIAALLGTLLSERRDPPPAPMRLLRPVAYEPPPALEYMAAAA